jgi:uncharacterized membrane protein
MGHIVKPTIWFAATAIAVGMLAISSAAHGQTAAPLTFCNATSAQVYIAVGYHSSGVNDAPGRNVLTGPFVSRGWWWVDPGTCETIDNPFKARYMFWFAISKGYNDSAPDVQAGETAESAAHFCVPWYFSTNGRTTRKFTFEDENESLTACHAGGTTGSYRLWIVSHRVDIAVDPRVRFTGSDTN